MSTPNIGDLPLTGSILKKTTSQDAPALIKEWQTKYTTPGSFAILSMGMVQGGNGRDSRAWSAFSLSDDPASTKSSDSALKPEVWERILSAIAPRTRMQILLELFRSPKMSAAISHSTGLKGGALYHHLHALTHAGLIEKKSRAYALSPLGLEMLMSLSNILHNVRFDSNGTLIAS